MISFGVIGASIKTGNVNLLSTLTVPEADRTAVLQELKDACGFSEMVAVFTCNRVEFYFMADGEPPSVRHRNKLLDFFLRGKNKAPLSGRGIARLHGRRGGSDPRPDEAGLR